MRRTAGLCNPWAAHVRGKKSVKEMYMQLVRKGVLEFDSRQCAMAEACDPILAAAEDSAARWRQCDWDRSESAAAALEEIPAGSLSWWRHATHLARDLTKTSATVLGSFLSRDGSTALAGPFSEYCGAAERRGLYLRGGVGTGKTMILDLFDLADCSLPKRRAHLHSFMTDVSDRLVKSELELRKVRRSARGSTRRERALANVRPIDLVVEGVMRETPVLCFDEFQTFDVAHAALLASFFTTAFQRGLFLVTTSNRFPEELCTISASFSEFMPLLRSHCTVLDAGSARDYRDRPVSEQCHSKVFLSPATKTAAAELLGRVERGILRSSALQPFSIAEHGVVDGTSLLPRESPLWIKDDVMWHHGRSFTVSYRCGGVAVFDFQDLCGCRQELASSDYQMLAFHFHTVVMYNVPQIGTANRNAAHQFIVLVDELYQQNVRLLFTSQVPWHDLMDGTRADGGRVKSIEGSQAASEEEYYSEGEDDRSGYRAVYSFRNEEEVMSFSRIRSRLQEMGCSSYMLKQHRAFLVDDFDFSCLVKD